MKKMCEMLVLCFFSELVSFCVQKIWDELRQFYVAQ